MVVSNIIISMELFVLKYFFYICIQFPQFFTVFNNILNILNLFIDLLSLLRNYED